MTAATKNIKKDQDWSRDQALASIASEHLNVETLEAQGLDSLDFHDVSCWSIKAALVAAYEAGKLVKVD